MPKDFSPKEESVKLLCKTFSPLDMDKFPERAKRVEVLMRLFTAIDAAARYAPHNEGITFNGERPNDHDALGAYIVNGGRLLFDMSKLSHKEQKWFADFIMPPEIQRQGIIYKRAAGTHRVAKKRVRHHKHGHSYTFFYEKRLTPLQSCVNVLKEIFGIIKPRHYGMNVGIGGTGRKTTDSEGAPVVIEEDGCFGHLYFNTRTEAIQFGFEEAAPLKPFTPGGGWHGPEGKGVPHSAFLSRRIEHQTFGPEGQDHIIDSIDEKGRYAWNRILITPEVIAALAKKTKKDFDAANEKAVKATVKAIKNPPKNCEAITDYVSRNLRMRDYRHKHGLSEASSKDMEAIKLKFEHHPVVEFYLRVIKQLSDPLQRKYLVLSLLQHKHKDMVELQNLILRSFPELTLKAACRHLEKEIKKLRKEEYKDKKERIAAKKKSYETITKINTQASLVISGAANLDDAVLQALLAIEPKAQPKSKTLKKS